MSDWKEAEVPVGTNYKECYLHLKKPAIHSCAKCGRPTCKLCELETGDPSLCLPCFKILQIQEDSKMPVPSDTLNNQAQPTRDIPFQLGEVTVHKDGHIEAPQAEPDAEPPNDADASDGLETSLISPDSATREVDELMDGAEIPTTVVQAQDQVTAPGIDLAHDEEIPVGAAFEYVSVPGSPAVRLMKALPLGIFAATCALAVWLVLALLTKRWSQVAILTIGLIVPWALYKGETTRSGLRKRGPGRSEPANATWIAVASFVVVACVMPLAEFFAYMLVTRSSPVSVPFSAFMSTYFKPLDWVVIGIGLTAALIVPFLLTASEHWRTPTRNRRRRVYGKSKTSSKKTEEVTGLPEL